MSQIRLILPLLCLLILNGCSLISVDLDSFMGPQPMQESVLVQKSADKILIIEVLGPISTAGIQSTFSYTEAVYERLDEILRKAGRDHDIKGILLRIDSPGGEATASTLTYRALKQFKNERNIPVLALITNYGTSGAYMAALSADKIMALPTSIVGSVGVIMPSLNFTGLLDKLGIEDTAITSGELKDAGSPTKKMTDKDRAIFEAIIMEEYGLFIEMVKENRPVTEADLQIIGDGRIMTPSAAKQHNLIDAVGYYEDALKMLSGMIGNDDLSVVRYRRRGESEGSFYTWP